MSGTPTALCVETNQPPRCEVLPFPAVRRVGKVRRTAEVLLNKSGKGADHYWRQVVDGMRSQMTGAGIPEEQIDRELRAFADAVFGIIHASDGDSAA